MVKTFAKSYKIPLFLSVTLTIVLFAIKATARPQDFVMILCGSLLGTFFLDLDYLIYAFFLEPTSEFSKTFAAFVKHGDIGNAASYIHYHKSDIKQKTLNSALFQIVLAGVAVFILSSETSLLLKAMILSTYANSFYRLAESYYEKNSYSEWFWALKSTPTRNGVYMYLLVLGGVFAYCLRLL
jgi:hypothetical protein